MLIISYDTECLLNIVDFCFLFFTVLTWLKEQPPLTDEELQDLRIEMADFQVC